MIFVKNHQKWRFWKWYTLLIFIKNHPKMKILESVTPVDFCPKSSTHEDFQKVPLLIFVKNHQKWRFCIKYPYWFLSKLKNHQKMKILYMVHPIDFCQKASKMKILYRVPPIDFCQKLSKELKSLGRGRWENSCPLSRIFFSVWCFSG